MTAPLFKTDMVRANSRNGEDEPIRKDADAEKGPPATADDVDAAVAGNRHARRHMVNFFCGPSTRRRTHLAKAFLPTWFTVHMHMVEYIGHDMVGVGTILQYREACGGVVRSRNDWIGVACVAVVSISHRAQRKRALTQDFKSVTQLHVF